MSEQQFSLASELKEAQVFHHRVDLEEAERLYCKILMIVPDCTDALNYLGILRFQRGDAIEAETLLRRAISIQPDDPGPHNNLANILRTGGDVEAALPFYARAAELAPDDPEVQKNYSLACKARQRAETAIEHFRRSTETNPAMAEEYERLGRLLYREGKADAAADVFRRWLEQDPANVTAQHMLAACSGVNVPERASDQFIRDLFDGYADSFDESLAKLKYKAPELLIQALKKQLSLPYMFAKILDAGCGTGACGPLLKPMTQSLSGLDLSAGMLARAKVRNVYDELHQAELTQYLRLTEQRFDIVVSADVLIYFGDLQQVMHAVSGVLKDGGLFAFTIERQEAAQSGTYELAPSGRYAHSDRFVQQQAGNAGLATVDVQHFVLRKELGKPVGGLLFVCKKIAATSL